MKDLVNGDTALVVLSQMRLKGKIAYIVSKAARKVRPEIEDYKKGLQGILESYNAKADINGILRLDPDKPKYKAGRIEIEEYKEEMFKKEITFEGIILLKLDDLLDAILPKLDKDGKEVEEGGIIEAFILEGISWLLDSKEE